MDKLRIGVIGLGVMGAQHAQDLASGRVSRCVLTAVSDQEPKSLARFPHVRHFSTSEELIGSGETDAVVIATPHYSHTTIGIDALEHGLHVMTEKPISVHKADCERLLAAHRDPKQVFAAMFNVRTHSIYRRLKQLIDSGELGEIRRVNWIVTNWFRTNHYYAMGRWRATWAGEGGGVLLNQCPHNLDLFQWLFGMPARVRGFCRLGHYHSIEVEDDVTAYMELSNGASAVFIASTGEAPGTNRLEIAGEQGRVVLENNTISYLRNEVPTSVFSQTSTEPFSLPPVWEVKIPVTETGGNYIEMLQNFVDAILDGTPLIAPAAEGIRSVELANAILYSSCKDQTIELPLDSSAYEELLTELIAGSSARAQEGIQTK